MTTQHVALLKEVKRLRQIIHAPGVKAAIRFAYNQPKLWSRVEMKDICAAAGEILAGEKEGT